MVLDSHTHAWGPPSDAHPWVNGPLMDVINEFQVDLVYDDKALLADMDSVGVDEAVVVGYPICDWRDNWYTINCVKEHDRLYGIVMIDQFANDAVDRLREYLAIDGILGFRLGALCPYDRMWETFDRSTTWLKQAIELEEFWHVAIETDAFVQVLAHQDQLDQAIALVETYPELSYAFDHYGHTDPAISPDESNFSRFAKLAEFENVAVKLSETPHWSNQTFPYLDIEDHVAWLLDHFGRERIIWGSDFPNVSDVATYEEAFSWLEHLDVLSTADLEWLTEKAFRRHVGI